MNIVLIFIFFLILVCLRVSLNYFIFSSIAFLSFLKALKIYKLFSLKFLYFFLSKIFLAFKIVLFNKIYLYPILILFIYSWISEIILFSSVMDFLKEIIIEKIKKKKEFENLIVKTMGFFFIDDYLASFAVKNLYYNFINYYGVSKEKFAYLISSNAPFISSLFFISSWGSFFFSSLKSINSLKEMSPYSILFFSVPYFFYPIISIFFSWVIRNYEINYGPIKIAEENANENLKNSYLNKEIYLNKENNKFSKKEKLFNILKIFIYLIPFLFVLIVFFKKLFCIFLFSKNFMNGLSKINFSEIMLFNATKGFLLMLFLLFFLRKITLINLFKTFIDTISILKSSILTLVLAWTFLGEINFLLESFNFSINFKKYIFIKALFPFLISIFSFFTSFLFSSSWGAMSFLIPFLFLFNGIYDLKVIFAAIISGAICGNSLSKNSDTNLIASNCAKIDSKIFYKAQLYYTLPAVILSFISFFFYGIISLFFTSYLSLIFVWIINIFILSCFFLFIKKKQLN